MGGKIMSEAPVFIDQTLCTGCGTCARVCPKEILTDEEDKTVVRAGRCLLCGHCEAACPQGAIALPGLDPDAGVFETFTSSEQWLPFGGSDTGELVRLMRSRRSSRNFTTDPVAPELLRDLIRIGITAPSGTNSQQWTFTIVSDRAGVNVLGGHISGFFRKLNRMAGNAVIRRGLALLGKPELQRYYQRHSVSVREALRKWDEEGVDLLFHGATAMIVVGSRPGASCPAEDALLATQNMLLGAHTLGLGTCLIGYAVEAMRRDRGIARSLSIPDEERVHSVIALGHPAEVYARVTGRKRCTVRFSPSSQNSGDHR
jgi:nitroreductase/NAD-dependent dihydropyrimidine dehydrogenase PreA subunit